MSYIILPRQKANAKKLGVSIKPSINKNKKIDIYRDGKKIADAGAIGYKDYSVYLKDEGNEMLISGVSSIILLYGLKQYHI